MSGEGDVADLMARLGGGVVVGGVVESPVSALRSFVWSPREHPAWYRLGVVGCDGQVRLTPREVRVWGRPRWSPSGQLAVGGFIGIARAVFDVDVDTAAVTVVAGRPDASYELLEYLGPGEARCRRRGVDGSVVVVGCRSGDEDVVIGVERGPRAGWGDAELVRWQAGGCDLEGVFVPPADGGAPWPTVTFLHGGPVGAFASGEQDRVGAWADPRWATFVAEFPASGVCGETAMLAAFEARELPDLDHEVDTVLAGIDSLIAAGRADRDRLFIVGHSYGAYLVNRAVTHTHRFRAAVCWEGAADLRTLDASSVAMQAQWRGGSPEETPQRWSAASPIDRVDRVRTPMLLVYGAKSRLASHGEQWNLALRRAGAATEMLVDPLAGHTFDTDEGADVFHDRVAQWFEAHGAH